MTQVGQISVIAKIDTSQYKRGAAEIESANSKIEGSTENTASRGSIAMKKLAKVGIAAVVAAAVAAGAAIVKNIGGAIQRVDRLVSFPRVLKALGVSGDDAQKSTDRLAKSLQGLPTSLGEAAAGVQGLVTSGVDIRTATDAFLGLNNAMLAAGTDAGAAASTMTQLNQALSRGRIDGAEWNSIAANIPTVLQALQNETGKSKDELREMFRQNPQALIDNIIRLNKKGGGGIASLEKQARDATGGIGTAFANVDNAIQRAIENIVRKIGGGDLAKGQKIISKFIQDIGTGISTGLTFIADAIEQVIIWLQPLINYIKENKVAAEVLKTTLLILGAVLVGSVLAAIVLVVGIAAALTAAINTLVKAFQWVMKTAIDTWNNIVKAWRSAVGFFNGITSSIRSTFSRLTGFFSGLFGTIVGLFRNVGTRIGNAIGGAFRGAINSVLGWVVGKINGFIDGINSVVDTVNKLPGVSVGRVSRLPIPQLATGGIVTSATLAMIGEGSEPEAVIPLSKLDKMLSGDGGGARTEYNIGEITISSEVDGERWLRRLTGNQEIVSNGLVPTQSYM